MPLPCSKPAAAAAPVHCVVATGAPLELALALGSLSKRRAVIVQAAAPAIIPAPLPTIAFPPFRAGDEEVLANPEAPPAASFPAVLNNAAYGTYADCGYTW